MAGLLVLLAHPDDEFFCAGLIAALRQRGVPVHLVCWTGGEGGMSSRQRFWLRFPYFMRPRIREMRRSASKLNVTSLTFLRYIDPPPKNGLAAPVFDNSELKQRISSLIARYQVEMIVTHGSDGDYQHPAHQALHRLIRELSCEANRHPLLFMTFNASWPDAPKVRFLNQNDPADCLLDSRPYLRKKLQVFHSHRSQASVLKRMVKSSGTSLNELLRATRYEGYRCWNDDVLRETALKKFQHWTGATDLSAHKSEKSDRNVPNKEC